LNKKKNERSTVLVRDIFKLTILKIAKDTCKFKEENERKKEIMKECSIALVRDIFKSTIMKTTKVPSEFKEEKEIKKEGSNVQQPQ